MNLNQLTGADLMAARTHIGLSISATAKLTGVNRNTLSQFEQEKATLTNTEKKRLVDCYEDRGYDFNEPQLVDETSLAQRYDSAQDHLTEVARSSQVPSGLGEAILALADASHDMMSVLVRPDNAQQEEKQAMPEAPESYLLTEEALQRHFEADKAGEMKGKVGFFKEDADERSAKLIAHMAKQYLVLMNVQSPDVFSLERDGLDDDSDNARVLDTLENWLGYDALKELAVEQ
ncbi:helix-turn-helix domain-containing protein [Vibrio fluvialis]|nr:helix-turn-helix domain-containing protein [Vibrio fluvialis]MBY7824335.1 helix-turn-helix domain-containing protein [Vibrio fluvialis]